MSYIAVARYTLVALRSHPAQAFHSIHGPCLEHFDIRP